MVPVGDLVPYPRNPRQGDVGAIVQSLQAHGQFRALVVNKRNMQVLAGNHTLAALKEIGAKEALCHFVDVDDGQAARIVLVDNRANDLACNDEPALIEMLKGLPDLEGTGYDGDALDDLLKDGSWVPEPGESESAPERWDVLVSCDSEPQQAQLLERFESEGLRCRALIS